MTNIILFQAMIVLLSTRETNGHNISESTNVTNKGTTAEKTNLQEAIKGKRLTNKEDN